MSDNTTFYHQISDLKIELKELNDNRQFDMTHVCVYQRSKYMAESVIEVQEKLVRKRSDIQIDFDKTKQEMMKYCCGRTPPQELIDKYNNLTSKMVAEKI